MVIEPTTVALTVAEPLCQEHFKFIIFVFRSCHETGRGAGELRMGA